MFGLKIFVRVQTFRRGPPLPLRNFCHPGCWCIDSVAKTVHAASALWMVNKMRFFMFAIMKPCVQSASKPVLTFTPMMVADLNFPSGCNPHLLAAHCTCVHPPPLLTPLVANHLWNSPKSDFLQRDGLLPLPACWFCWASHWCRHSWKVREWDLQKQQKWHLQS